jgi:mRNA interferase MazF
VMVIPFTSQLGAKRFPHTIVVQPTAQNGLTMESILLVSQLRAIDVRRLQATLGQLDSNTMSLVNDEIRYMLDL